MARDRDNNTTPADTVDAGLPPDANAPSTTTEGTAATPAEPKKDERFIMVTRPGTTDLVKRSELIKELWTGAVTTNNPEGKKHTRGEIKNIINKPEVRGQNKEIPYQIVFAATKGVAGGPPKEAAAAPAEGTAPAGDTPAAS